MPALYLAIKHSLRLKKGMSEKEAEGHAARIFNAKRPEGIPPVTGHEGKENSHEKNKKRTDRSSHSSEY